MTCNPKVLEWANAETNSPTKAFSIYTLIFAKYTILFLLFSQSTLEYTLDSTHLFLPFTLLSGKIHPHPLFIWRWHLNIQNSKISVTNATENSYTREWWLSLHHLYLGINFSKNVDNKCQFCILGKKLRTPLSNKNYKSTWVNKFIHVHASKICHT